MATFKHLVCTILVLFTSVLLVSGLVHDDEQPLAYPVDENNVITTSTESVLLGDVENAWYRLTAEAQEAARHIKEAIDGMDLGHHLDDIKNIPGTVKEAIGRVNVTSFEEWLIENCENSATTFGDALLHLRAIKLEDLPEEALQYVKDHPGEVALYAVETIILFVPGGFYGPILRAAGFTKVGIRASKFETVSIEYSSTNAIPRIHCGVDPIQTWQCSCSELVRKTHQWHDGRVRSTAVAELDKMGNQSSELVRLFGRTARLSRGNS